MAEINRLGFFKIFLFLLCEVLRYYFASIAQEWLSSGFTSLSAMIDDFFFWYNLSHCNHEETTKNGIAFDLKLCHSSGSALKINFFALSKLVLFYI